MSTADLQVIVNGVETLAVIGACWSLVFFRRVLLAASPKPQAVPQDKPEKKAEAPPAPEAETAPIATVRTAA